jgi:integrase
VSRHWRELYVLTTFSYLRPGEAFALEWSAINMPEGYVQIAGALDFDTGKAKTTKTKAGRRLPIHPNLRPMLNAWVRQRSGQGA